MELEGEGNIMSAPLIDEWMLGGGEMSDVDQMY